MNKKSVLRLLDDVVHPETGRGLAEGDFVESVFAENGHIEVVLKFRRPRDPFAASLVRQVSEVLGKAFPKADVSVSVATSAPPPAKPETTGDKAGQEADKRFRLPGDGKIIAVASGKGGVGKSTVAAHLAVALAAEGYRVGLLDADVYGPSQPWLFGVEDYVPVSKNDDGRSGAENHDADKELIVPAESMGVEIMSIGFFIAPDDALVWRGPMASSALKQLIRQTDWGALDYLLVDLPPGTGDVHLTVVHELAFDGAVIVSTPGRLAEADVRRGIEMFRSEGIDVPVLGIVENMAWFTPPELPDRRYYIFGQGDTKRLAEAENIEFLGELPMVMATKSNDAKSPLRTVRDHIASAYANIARKIVEKLDDKC